MNRPESNEYDRYYETYVSLVEETDIVTAMQNQLTELEKLFGEITEEKSLHAYAPGKWTIKELLGHLTDGERIFAYRALRISRADQTPIEGFEQDGYIENSNFNGAKLTDLTEELILTRKANLILFKNLPDEAWTRTGTASDVPVSVRALAYIMVGHIRHHLNILRERYL
ncbi:MAG TPA: DinB family protein [Pyrinomonadaceae bacterium]|nr:DinB family protein [Pyrinomonadaceae bacterium]